MRFVIQRVSRASVTVDGQVTGAIDKGYMVLMGACSGDTEKEADRLVKKMLGLRIFEDSGGKTNLSLRTVGGSLLIVSQFTLYADCRKGNRPSFSNAGAPDKAEALYEYVLQRCRTELDNWNKEDATDIYRVEKGIFGADMKVSLLNDGPFTILLDSAELS